MKTHALVVLSTGLVLGGLAASPAVAADPAPIDVKIAWKDNTFQAVHVSWDEAGDRSNVIRVRSQTSTLWSTVVPAGTANVVDVPANLIPRDAGPLDIAVAVGDAEGDTSPVAASPQFDTDAPVTWPDLGRLTQLADGLTVEWTPPVDWGDSTPGDPLDRPDAIRYLPQYEVAGQVKPLGGPITATALTFTNPVPKYDFGVRARNEWGTGPVGAKVNVSSAQLTTSVPARVLYGQPTVIKGNVGHPGGEFMVVLQARNSATSAWYVVGTTTTYWNDSSFSFQVTAAGTRQYRVAVPDLSVQTYAWFGGFSAPVTTTTGQRITSAAFAAPTVRRGQTATANLTVEPRFTGRIHLQKWNGTTWVHVKDVLINAGRASGQFVSTAPGRVAYRYYVPNITYNGLLVAAAYSPNFVLTTV
ncbi:fibronectin type III domain-containing protein [Kribbella sp. CA-253562]|uniref:fibronectin type III domain-containing protein n=1 Tax=Kribbella sp. CA-253562 TaxID=3239942 RepID=UPI003D8F5375